MYARLLSPPVGKKSYFLFGPRGTGKTSFIREKYRDANYLDLLDEELFLRLNAEPHRLQSYILKPGKPVIIDEVQRIPAILNEIHRLIEEKRLTFILTGSSARKLRKAGVNLLAGRALSFEMFPLTSFEAADDFKLEEALKWGMLPGRFSEADPAKFLYAYVVTYLKEEVQQERLTDRKSVV